MRKRDIGETIKIAADLPVGLHDRLTVESDRQMTNKSTIIRKALSLYLDDPDQTDIRESRNNV